jgi:hypothetical protein
VDDINNRSSTGQPELEIVDKVKGSGYYIYKIEDYTLTATRERGETRLPGAGGIPKTRLAKNRRTTITKGGSQSGLSREAVYSSPVKAKMLKSWGEVDPSQLLKESGLKRLPLRPGEGTDETSSISSLGSLGSGSDLLDDPSKKKDQF